MSAQAAVEQSKVKHSKFKQKFKQQRLPAWQPILTADTVLPAFFLIGLLFVPLGAALLFFSRSVQELQLDYTECLSIDHKLPTGEPRTCQDVIRSDIAEKCFCKENFTVHESFEKNVYLYYGLDNFYQNHRRYVKSRDDKQLLGKEDITVSNDCAPFAKDSTGKVYAPCGAIANSMFNGKCFVYGRGHLPNTSL
ncbi:cell cycle control protein 50A [Panulirus ornatus]|uniref:cell cycle control protein 50A n=1 Tax=Panulirus ornatus TaxID=150431 RepID=UPI003A869DA0